MAVRNTYWRKVLFYEQVTPNGIEYKFKLSCGHTVTRFFTRFRNKMPSYLMCSQCWWNCHDNKGNPI